MVLVLLAVAIVFDSAWAALMVFLSLPLCLAGVAGIFWATKTSFSREAAVGVILVVGLAVNQSILLVDAALEKKRAGQKLGGRAAANRSVERAKCALCTWILDSFCIMIAAPWRCICLSIEGH